jgi:hypothetical protein
VTVRALPFAVLAATLALADLCLIGAPARAESLAEIAAKEKARRKGTTETVITDDDLRNEARRRARAGDVDQAATTTEGTTEGTQKAAGEKTDEEQRDDRAKGWRERNQKAQEEVARLNDQIAKMQAELADMRVYQYGPNRAARLKQLEEAQAQLQIAQQRVDDLEEERRREGYAE